MSLSLELDLPTASITLMADDDEKIISHVVVRTG
jgi:hypothetical protein